MAILFRVCGPEAGCGGVWMLLRHFRTLGLGGGCGILCHWGVPRLRKRPGCSPNVFTGKGRSGTHCWARLSVPSVGIREEPRLLSSMTTSFVARLRANDQAAWFELWQTFGPVVRAQLMKWGNGRIGAETVRDLSQETMAALSNSIDRYDPSRGARFSTWLLAIAKHVLGDEIDRRMAAKRGKGRRAASLEEAWMTSAKGLGVDEAYEAAVFRAKVEAAIRKVERESDFTDFEIFRMRVFEGQSGKDVAAAVGVSEPTVSRRLAKVRTLLRSRVAESVATFSFTPEELAEGERNGLVQSPNKADDALFDEAVGDIFRRQMELRATGESEGRY